jgi:hypothetical protein
LKLKVDCCIRTITPKVTLQINQSLIAPVSMALNQLAPLKAPEPDGLLAFFSFNKIRKFCTNDAIKYFFETSKMNAHINSTLIAFFWVVCL